MGRNRIWVNFSKEYTEEYFNAVKEENFSSLVCSLLRQYYIQNRMIDDYMYNKLVEIDEKLEELLKEIVNNKK